jgi:4-amino-4-deoxy-L-arabinose transferase-like glycosyltransferase
MLASSVPRSSANTGRARRLAQSKYFDHAIGIALVLLTAVMLLPGDGAVPMWLWDESRNANNAIEMVTSGHWLVTTYSGLPDHWNTKPPLLIWMVAALLKAGLPPLLALRLPSAIATAAIVLVLFAYCRLVLNDRLAGIIATILVLTSTLFVGPHVAQTGDYDALLSLFILLQVVAFERYLNTVGPRRNAWLALAGAALALAVLTKSVAGLFVLPGLLACVVFQRRLLRVARDPHLWITAFTVLLVCLGYYASREFVQPGYLWDVWQNELGGRYQTSNSHLAGGPLYYVSVLLMRFEPGFVLLPRGIVPLLRQHTDRRNIALICLCAAGSLLLVITSSATKTWWYAAPAVPLLSLAVGVGLTDARTPLQAPRARQRIIDRPAFLKAPFGVLLGVALVASLYWQNVATIGFAERPTNAQWWYGAFLDELRPGGLPPRLFIVDDGVQNASGLANYNPIADFYRKDAERRGEVIAIAPLDRKIAAGSWVITCDPTVKQDLPKAYHYTVYRSSRQCEFGMVGAALIHQGTSVKGDSN